MNICITLVLIGLVSYIILVRLHPFKMRYWADWLNARADAEDFNTRRMQEYLKLREEKEGIMELERWDRLTRM